VIVVAGAAAGIVVAIVVLTRTGAGHTPPPARPSLAAGVNFNCLHASPRDRAAVFADLRAAGVAWVRINVTWDGLEPSRGRYSRNDLAFLDRCVAEARAHRLEILVVFLGTPAWARSGGTDLRAPLDPGAYAAALGFLASRYRTEVAAWEIWNEENSPAFWSNGSAHDYVRLLRDSYRSVKRAAPRALVVFGGTLGNDTAWLRACYRAGAKGYFDVMATHPYPAAGKELAAAATLGSVRKVRRLMLAHRDRKPIWFTEVGWSAPFAVTAHEQAVALRNALDYTASRLPYVKSLFWFEAKNEVPGIKPGSWQGGLSLLAPSLARRPAFNALAGWIRAHPAR
jgi:hypothetical protein